MIEGGIYDCVLALGFEKMEKGIFIDLSLGSLQLKYPDRTQPLDKIFLATNDIVKDISSAPFAT
jgi:sterol carrier protein 2